MLSAHANIHTSSSISILHTRTRSASCREHWRCLCCLLQGKWSFSEYNIFHIFFVHMRVGMAIWVCVYDDTPIRWNSLKNTENSEMYTLSLNMWMSLICMNFFWGCWKIVETTYANTIRYALYVITRSFYVTTHISAQIHWQWSALPAPPPSIYPQFTHTQQHQMH